MSAVADRVERLGRDRLGLVLVIAAYGACVAYGLMTHRYLNDEGILTHIYASITAQEFAPAFFWQKTRPPAATLYAPVAAAGLTPFLVAHAAVGALVLPLIAATARSLGQPAPNLVAAVVGLSPLYIGAAACGVTNADAVVGLSLFAYLATARGKPFAAGLVLGALVWVRAELVLWALIVAAYALLKRRYTMLGGALVFPVLYAVAGAVYHGDALWMAMYPPSLPAAMPGNPYLGALDTPLGSGELVGTALAISPVIAVALFARRLEPLELYGALFVVALCTALVVLPAFGIFNFDRAPRYMLPILPFVALLVGRGLAAIGEGPRRRGAVLTVVLAACCGLAFAAQRQGAGSAGLASVALVAGAVALARAGRAVAARAVIVAMVAVGPIVFADGARVDRFAQAPHLDEMVARLAEVGDGSEPRRVYTNEPLLAPYLAQSGRLPWADVVYIVQADQLYEVRQLTNPHNGQREAIMATLREEFYGAPVFPRAFAPDAVPSGSLFALAKDVRLSLAMPHDAWQGHLTVLHPGYRMTIAELTREAP